MHSSIGKSRCIFYENCRHFPTSFNRDGGYAVEDFDTVDPALGTNKDLENLTRELRKAGISLCLDFVMNHTASTHRWAMAADVYKRQVLT